MTRKEKNAQIVHYGQQVQYKIEKKKKNSRKLHLNKHRKHSQTLILIHKEDKIYNDNIIINNKTPCVPEIN